MEKGITVAELYAICEQQIKKGNGKKHIVISDDDEGNGYHTLFYGFMDNKEDLQLIKEEGLFQDDNDVNDIVALG